MLNGDLAYIFNKESTIKNIYKDNNSILQFIYVNQERRFFTITILPDNTELLSNLTYAKVIQIVKIEINNIKVRLKGIGKC